MHLAAAALLVALPFSGCGDASDYAESGTITLTSDITTVEVKKEVVFTVVSDPKTPTTTTTASAAPGKVLLEECDMALEYRSDGAGVNKSWTSIPGSGPTRVFKLVPHEIGTLNVISRGKCVGSTEEWEYSESVKVTVSDKTFPEVTAVTLTANPSTVEIKKPVTFTLGATVTDASSGDKCTLNLSYQYSGAGLNLTTVYPAYVGQFILTPKVKGTLTVTAHGWCSENSTQSIETTVTVTATDEILPMVTGVTLTATPTTVVGNGSNPITYTLSVTKEAACTLQLSTVVSGAGLSGTPIWQPGTHTLTPTLASGDPPATLTVTTSAWCSENTAVVKSATATVTVTAP